MVSLGMLFIIITLFLSFGKSFNDNINAECLKPSNSISSMWIDYAIFIALFEFNSTIKPEITILNFIALYSKNIFSMKWCVKHQNIILAAE
jgi:hypothetical protein